MDIKDILSKVDHTLLNPKATWEEIKNICDDGMKYSTASVCIPPSFVKRAKEECLEASRLRVCAVVGCLVLYWLYHATVKIFGNYKKCH